MAGDELGSVILGVRVDASDATKGLAEVGEALDQVGKEAGDFESAVDKSFNNASESVEQLGKSANNTGDDIEGLGGLFTRSAAEIAKGTDKIETGFVGLDGLKDVTGELDSSLKGLGGAIGLVSPEAERMLMAVGDMSGGLEASSRLAKLAGVSHRALLLALGPLTIAIGAAAAAFALMKMEQEQAEAVAKVAREGLIATTALQNQSLDVLRTRLVLLGEMTQLEANRESLLESQQVSRTSQLAEETEAQNELTESTRGLWNSVLTLVGSESTATATARARLLVSREQLEAGDELRDDQIRTLDVVEATTAATEAATVATAENTAATTAAAAAAAVLALNRQADLDLLGAADPLLAIFLQRSQAIADMRTAGLTSERAHLLNLQNEVELEAGRAAALETTAEAVEALDPKIASLAIQSKAAASAAEAHALAIENGDNALAASAVAMSGFFDLASQMSGENANELKALAIAETTINGLAAGIKAFAELGPVAGGIAAAGIAASTAAALMQIEGQAIPTMHSGGIVGGGVGDRTINAQSGEAVLNRQAVANIGGPRAVEDLNNSQSGGAGGGVVVNLSYRQRAFDSVVIDNLAKGGPLRSALNRAASKGRRRQGGVL
tara:strand:- start:103 stop:1947 length:1845 start_codon:yes stop_codon:yes gene_type:complete